ncbi:hypothetical protein HHK36_023167 [Tetracentron sinense]|uniref:non-specific serine/threonine protein kinase n=1 Tax=Tetracentron sinense TaxID=13715 RepID=A0A835D557_TETSI|nr:hypothetical protein HHK36_023167 [Tetracentron sinense]
MAASDMRLVFLFYLLVSITSSCYSISSRNSSLRKQSSILVSLKQAFDISNSYLSSWNESKYMSLCSWTGIQCDDRNRSVVSLDILNSNISGSLSTVITELPSLINLSVAGNIFSGIFPPEIHKLTSLQYLNISNNQFNGSLNWNFSTLMELEVLDTSNSNFFGSLPLGVMELPKLKYLDLAGNYFSGKITPSYGGLKELNYLSLAGNDLGGLIPGELGKLTNLKPLYLGYYNEFEGGIPPEFGKLVNLVHLGISNCGLKGPIPPELGNLKKLDTLFLQINQLSGSIPPHFGNLSSLKCLDLSSNGLTGKIPVEFSELQELTLLNLFINKSHGEIPHFIADLPNLEVLKLWHNNFTGAIPPKLGQNGRLIEFDLSTNKLTGLVPRSFCFGWRLNILILLNNFLFGPLPDDLGKCDTLSRVRMGQNYLNGRLIEFDLSTNKLTGLVPRSLCFGRRLNILILLNNFLFGPLPDDLGKCVTLSRVRMGQNYLNGSIPNGFLYLPELSLMELQNNYLTGRFTEETSKVPSKFGQLNLSSNRLSGSLPSSIGNFTGLQILLLNGNQFTGSIPSELGHLERILTLDMSRNNFSGRIPPEIEFNDQNKTRPQVPGKYKLIFVLGLSTCSLIFVAVAIIKDRSIKRKNSKLRKLTAFQKLESGSQEILECLKDENIIGRGGAGIVYRGTMPNGETVAVKKLLGISKGSSHDYGFSAEIQTLGRIRHRNIVRLLKICSNKETNLLVYEYMPNGSLGEVLHGKRGEYLKWDTRLKIIMEAAKGLRYLHHDCSPLILHWDVKSHNILLDSNFEAHVANFGLTKFLQDTGMQSACSQLLVLTAILHQLLKKNYKMEEQEAAAGRGIDQEFVKSRNEGEKKLTVMVQVPMDGGVARDGEGLLCCGVLLDGTAHRETPEPVKKRGKSCGGAL